MNENIKNSLSQTEGTLLQCLRLLEKFDVSDSMLNNEYQISRTTLWRVRRGESLSANNHTHYFNVMMSVLYSFLKKAEADLDDERHKMIKDFMFERMLQEHKVIR